MNLGYIHTQTSVRNFHLFSEMLPQFAGRFHLFSERLPQFVRSFHLFSERFAQLARSVHQLGETLNQVVENFHLIGEHDKHLFISFLKLKKSQNIEIININI